MAFEILLCIYAVSSLNKTARSQVIMKHSCFNSLISMSLLKYQEDLSLYIHNEKNRDFNIGAYDFSFRHISRTICFTTGSQFYIGDPTFRYIYPPHGFHRYLNELSYSMGVDM